MINKSLIIFVLFFSSSVVAEDISDFQIEGMSIGDSLLDYLSREEIVTEIEINKPAYDYLSEDFGEVYLFSNFNTYYSVSFFVKLNDKNFIIYSIHGNINYDDNIDGCYAKQKEIEEEFSSLYNNAEKLEGTSVYPTTFDPSGKSNMRWISFLFKSGDSISIECKQYEKSLKIKNAWSDTLTVSIDKKEVNVWFGNL